MRILREIAGRRSTILTPIIVILLQILNLQSIDALFSVYTFKYSSGSIPQSTTSSLLFWEVFTGDQRQLENAVHGGSYRDENSEHKHPIFVCRAIIEGIASPGSTVMDRGEHLCINSMHTSERRHRAFEILVNKGHGSRLRWQKWNKNSGSIPTGSVCVFDGHNPNTYIARRKSPHEHHADYVIGRQDPSDQFGKIFVLENHDEVVYEDGEILTEIEPTHYEMRKIKINSLRKSMKRNQTLLGESVLSNPEENPTEVDTIISYFYDKEQFWGTFDGMVRGLNITIFEGDTNQTITWGLKDSVKTVQNTVASATLQPGTGLNVTVKGNYTTTEAYYTAEITTYWTDNSEPKKHKIEAYMRRADMQDIKMILSPIYWIHNQTFVPTTTTTTTTTTSTTQATTTSREPKPLSPPSSIEREVDNNEIDDSPAHNEFSIEQNGGSHEIQIGEQKVVVGSMGGGIPSKSTDKNKDDKSGSDRTHVFGNLILSTLLILLPSIFI